MLKNKNKVQTLKKIVETKIKKKKVWKKTKTIFPWENNYYDFSDFQDMSSRFNNVLLIVSDVYVLQQRKGLQSHLTHHTYTK